VLECSLDLLKDYYCKNSTIQRDGHYQKAKKYLCFCFDLNFIQLLLFVNFFSMLSAILCFSTCYDEAPVWSTFLETGVMLGFLS
jgi:hypothetical protein